VIVSTINVNGIRAAIKQRSPENLGLLPWLAETMADVVCLQETRADDEQLSAALAPALSDGWHLASAGGDVKGRNGVAVLSRRPIKSVRDLGADEFALHGRYVEVDIDTLTVASVYIQTGEAATDRQLEKERFMAALAHRMSTLTDRDAVVCGDWNIAHTENDIKNWKGNVKKSGFLPAERQWLTELLAAGWVDVVRCCIPTSPARTPGGLGAEGRSTTTRAGASITSWRPMGWPRGRTARGWSGLPSTRCAGPTTLQ
jgi:exodeoxyribonuclease-3